MSLAKAPSCQPVAPVPDGALRADWRRRPIVLVGLMGSGKSTVGRRLAARLHWPFVDADSEIEAAAQMPIAEIFARFGEPHFRDGERRVIARLMEGGHKIIATGGGAFADAETRALILRLGTAIWLDASIETLVSRVAKRGHRPLLVGKDPATVLGELLAVRGPCYAQAPIRILSGNGPHEDSVNAILDELHRRDPKGRADQARDPKGRADQARDPKGRADQARDPKGRAEQAGDPKGRTGLQGDPA